MVSTRRQKATASARQVFETAELLEMILLEQAVNIKTLLLSQRVNKTFEATISASKKLQEKLWFRPVPQPPGRPRRFKVNSLIPRNYGSPGVRPSKYIAFRTAGSGWGIRIDMAKDQLWDSVHPRSWQKMLLAPTADEGFDCELWDSFNYDPQWKFGLWCEKGITVGEVLDRVRKRAGGGSEKETGVWRKEYRIIMQMGGV